MRTEHLQKLFGILLHGRFVYSLNLFIYSITHLCKYGLVDTYTLVYNLLLLYIFFAQIFPLWPMGALSFGSCVLLTHSHQCNFLSTSIFSDSAWCSRLICYIYCSSTRISYFLKDRSLTLFWKIILEKRFECKMCLLLWRYFFLDPLGWQRKEVCYLLTYWRASWLLLVFHSFNSATINICVQDFV